MPIAGLTWKRNYTEKVQTARASVNIVQDFMSTPYRLNKRNLNT